jgi:hypothetical protein
MSDPRFLAGLTAPCVRGDDDAPVCDLEKTA